MAAVSNFAAVRLQWGRNIAAGRELVGIRSAQALALAMGRHGYPVTRQAVGKWERGEAVPSDEHKAVLAAILHQEVRSLFPLAALTSEAVA